ncbi:unnamed protein product [Clonostachys rhizophaga]|uniref:Ribosome association toxin RatA n=1 Tax=Clonostachys rhizophaga TaxID=160324 RepID=A0A9N9VUI0_9HYPO|nr:unnamed protein product [Clonostachys rhizophaga]
MKLLSQWRVSVAVSLIISLCLYAPVARSDPNPPPFTDWGSVRCPPEGSSTTLPTPTYGSGQGLFVVCTEDVINVPAQEVYKALLDFRRYPTFSSFVIDIDFPDDFVGETPDDVYIGLLMTFHSTGVFPLVNKTSPEMVTVMKDSPDKGYLMVSWKYDDGLEGAFLSTEHPTILIDQGDGTTLCISYETYFSGPGALVLLPFKDNLQAQFAQHAADLKAYLES